MKKNVHLKNTNKQNISIGQLIKVSIKFIKAKLGN